MQKFERSELNKYRYIFGALAAPGKGSKGFLVVLGRPTEGLERSVVIDEVEAVDLYDLVKSAAVWDACFHADRWYGDVTNPTMTEFVHQVTHNIPGMQRFQLLPTLLAEKKKDFYEYAMPTLKKLITEGKLVLPPNGHLRDYVSKVDPGDISSMELGSVPAVEALTYAAVELNNFQSGGLQETSCDNNYKMI